MIGDELQRFAQNELVLGYTESERISINRSIQALKECINRKLDIPYGDMVVFGSYTRNTILPRAYDENSDVDILIVMDEVDWSKSQNVETYRSRLKGALDETYSKSYVARDFPCVKLGLGHIKFDIVPALAETTWYVERRYLIPSKVGGWMYTQPNDINDTLAKSNQYYGGNRLRSLIRLCKHWNAARQHKAFESYELEKIIINSGLLSSGYDYGDSFLSLFLNTISYLSMSANCGEECVIQRIRNCLQQRDEHGQRVWLKHLLPGFRS